MTKTEEKFQKMIEETGRKYDQALRKLAGGEAPERQAACLEETEKGKTMADYLENAKEYMRICMWRF